MQITLFTTPNCPQCRITKKMFDEAQILYEIVDLSTDADAMNMVKELGHVAAPVVIAGDKNWSGFRHGKILNLIAEIRSEKAHEQLIA